MFHFLIVLYGLSLTEAYNIQITGKIELGKELSQIFRELLPDTPCAGNTESTGSAEDAATNKVPTEYNSNKLNNKEVETVKDLTVLDKMVQIEQENVHLYGDHKLKGANDGGPLNNIHLRTEK